MLQLEDKTPFVSALSLLQDVLGIDTLYVAVKATFSLGDQLAVAEEQLPLRMADEFWGEPGESSLKYASDIHLAKPCTDVALVGRAHAPGKQPVEELDTGLGGARSTSAGGGEQPDVGQDQPADPDGHPSSDQR